MGLAGEGRWAGVGVRSTRCRDGSTSGLCRSGLGMVGEGERDRGQPWHNKTGRGNSGEGLIYREGRGKECVERGAAVWEGLPTPAYRRRVGVERRGAQGSGDSGVLWVVAPGAEP